MQPKHSELEAGGVSSFSVHSEAGGTRSRRRRADWRLGGRAVNRWGSTELAVALFGLGLGILLARVVATLPYPYASLLSLAALWLSLLAAVAFALLRARPVGLFRYRAVDLLWGLGLGLALRFMQGALSGANASAFPSVSDSGESLRGWVVAQAVPAGGFGPVIEEVFFRAVLLVALFELLRRSSGSLAAGVAATLISTGAFVCLHAAFAPLTLVDALSLAIVGAVCANLVLLTGRLWGAVLLHAMYNLSFLSLVAIGSRFS